MVPTVEETIDGAENELDAALADLGVLLAPIFDRIAAEQWQPDELLLCPSGLLNLLPLHAATLPGGDAVIDRYPVSVLPTAALAPEIARRQVEHLAHAAAARRAVVYGDPTPDFPLAHAREEAHLVAAALRTLGFHDVQPRIEAGATRADFLAESPLADHAQFHFLDFNEETLRHAGDRMEAVRLRHQRKTSIKFVRNSVQNLLRGRGKAADEPGYDLVYCSGLYDYLNDRIIKALNTYLYDQLKPGGQLVVGNFAPCTPVRNFIEHLLEWFLIYRDGRQLAALAPEQADPADCKVVAEPTGANIFLEVRKPQ